MKLSNIKSKLKSLFLEELQVDEGWNAYVDLILNNIDTSIIKYCRTNGFPQTLTLDSISGVFDVTYNTSNGLTTYSYPRSQNPQYLDFSSVEIVIPDGASISVNREEVDSSIGYFEVSGSDSFTITLPVKEGESPVLELLNIPEQLDPLSIQQYLQENFSAYDKNSSTISPQALYGAIASICNIKVPDTVTGGEKGLEFYLLFKSDLEYSSRIKTFREYAHFNQIYQGSRVVGRKALSYFGYSLSEKAPIDALRDKFGYVSQVSNILGYDKQYLVVDDNVKENELIYLTADAVEGGSPRLSVNPTQINFPQQKGKVYPLTKVGSMPYTYDNSNSVKVSASQDPYAPSAQVVVSVNPESTSFTPILSESTKPVFNTYSLTAQDVGVTSPTAPEFALLSPDSKIYRTLEGITKQYSMLSSTHGRLRNIEVYFSSSLQTIKEVLGDKYDTWYSSLVTILENSLPVGCGYTILFGEDFNRSNIVLSDNLYQSDEILVNGLDNREEIDITFSQRESSTSVDVETVPTSFEFDVEKQ